MTKSSLSSRLNPFRSLMRPRAESSKDPSASTEGSFEPVPVRLRALGKDLLFLLLGLFFLWVSSSFFLTVFLNFKLSGMRRVFEGQEMKLSYSCAYFNLLQGAVVNRISCSSPQAPLFEAKRLELGFHLPSVFKGAVLIKNISVKEMKFHSHELSLRSRALRETFKRLDKGIGFFPTSNFELQRLWIDDKIAFSLKGYLSFLSEGIIVSRGEALLKDLPFVEDLDPEALNGGSGLGRPFQYLLDMRYTKDTLEIERFEINNDLASWLGSGSLTGLDKEDPIVDLKLSVPHLILDTLPVLNSSNIQTRGLASFSFSWSGALSGPKSGGELHLMNADIEIFDNINISKLNANFTYAENKVHSSDIVFSLNKSPLEGNFSFSVKDGGIPRAVFDVRSSAGPAAKDTAFSFKGEIDFMKGRRVKGGIGGDFSYLTKDGLLNHFAVESRGFEVGVDEDVFLSSAETRLFFEVLSKKEKEARKSLFRRTFFLDNALAVIRKQKEGFSIEPIKAGCYRGSLEGWLRALPDEGDFSIKAEAHLRGMDLGLFAERSPGESSLIFGKLDGDLKLDTDEPKDMLRGQLFVQKGHIEQNSLLNAVSDFLGVASLKSLNFDDLSVFFNGGRGDYSSKVVLGSSKLWGLLEGRIFGYETMDGYLSIEISTALLNESKQFKRLLKYIGHEDTSVVFPFKISSYLESPRVLWLKNEFKDKLQNRLPERNKRFLQKQVNAMIEEMRTE